MKKVLEIFLLLGMCACLLISGFLVLQDHRSLREREEKAAEERDRERALLAAKAGEGQEQDADVKAEAPAEDEDVSKDPVCKLVLAGISFPDEPGAEAAEFFAERLSDLSGGSLSADTYMGYELGSGAQILSMTKDGTIEACLVPAGELAEYDPRYAVPGMPFAFADSAEAYAFVDGPFKEWVGDGRLEEKGISAIDAWDGGFRHLTNSQKPIEHPEDLEGLRIRTGFDFQLEALFTALGAEPKQIVFSELLAGLQLKAVDGQENLLSLMTTNMMWEHDQKYLTLTGHQWNCFFLVVNREFLDKLTPAQKEVLVAASAEARDHMREAVKEREQGDLAILKENGMEITETIDLKEFRRAVRPAWDALREYLKGETDLAPFNELIRKAAG